MRNSATTPTINNCIFVGNTGGEGGAVINESCSPKFTNCIFKGNTASYGGAISNAYGSSPILVNCTFFGNSSLYGGGGIIYNDGSLAEGVSSPILTNCIVWGNSGGIFNSGGSANINFSIVQGGCPAGSVCSNVSNVDPLFVSGSNLHLQTGSPAINAGTNTGAPATDFDGYPRIRSVTDPADMGIYEANPAPYASIEDKSITEGNTGTFLMKFKVTLDHAYGGTVKIKYSTADSTATAGSDHKT